MFRYLLGDRRSGNFLIAAIYIIIRDFVINGLFIIINGLLWIFLLFLFNTPRCSAYANKPLIHLIVCFREITVR